jgi:hypothetical protein
MSKRFRRRIGRAPLALLAPLALALTLPARAETPPAAIPLSDIGARATANYQGDALGVTATSDGARLRCGFQKLEAHATPEGLWLESTKPGAAGKLRVAASAICRAGVSTLHPPQCCYGGRGNPQPSTVLPATGTVSVEDKLVRFTRPCLTEEYSVSVDGVRQDFVIAAPPAGAGDLRVELALSGARAEAAAGGARLTLEGSGRALAYSRLRVEDATGRELTARLEVLSADRLAVSVADANATYPVRIDPTFSDADWVSLGSGMNNIVYTLAVSGTNLYAGGEFTNAGGVAVNYIAKWDGSAWSALGSGLGSAWNNFGWALAVSGNNLYVGGPFATWNGAPANGIAKWDGSAWSALGSGVSGDLPWVSALAVIGTNLYAGGYFTAAGGVPATGIAKWDGRAWSALGSGMAGGTPAFVSSLAVSGTNLYAGGYFTSAGGVSAKGIAKWNGSAWSALGSGVDQVTALAASGTNLYVGGPFATWNGAPANGIAKWDGSAWSALGSGGGGVNALVVSGTNLYAGGSFGSAGGVPANYIAKWNGSVWSALGSGVSGNVPTASYPTVNALAADGLGHLFVGGSFYLAGTKVSPCIAQANVGSVPTILTPPQTQTAEAGAAVNVRVYADGEPPPTYQWFLNGTNILSCTSSNLVLTNILFSQSGTYFVVVTNLFGAVTSAPATINVIPAVARRPVPGLKLMGQAGSLLNLDFANLLSPMPDWLPLDLVTLASTPQYYFDLSEPLPPQRYYRARQTAKPALPAVLGLHMVPAITLTGSIGSSVRLDYINRFGPIDAWVILATVRLTNTSQLYFDVSAPGQPNRLYRLVQVP